MNAQRQAGQHPLLAVRLYVTFTSPLLNRYLTQFGSRLFLASSSPMNLFHPPTSGSEYVGSHEEDGKGSIIRPATACIFRDALPFLIMAIAPVIPERERAG
jgi:hypothetical protein